MTAVRPQRSSAPGRARTRPEGLVAVVAWGAVALAVALAVVLAVHLPLPVALPFAAADGLGVGYVLLRERRPELLPVVRALLPGRRRRG